MIPKVIYMCHKEMKFIEKYSKNWKDLNPEYEIKLYDDEACINFLKEYFSQKYVDIFNYLKDGPIKCDFWRVCILYKYGGIYVDADINPIVPLDDYIDDTDEFVTCISRNFRREKREFQLNPHFIKSTKEHPILKQTIDKYLNKFDRKEKYDYWKWSICKLLTIPGIFKKEPHTIVIDNVKYKFIFERSKNECVYNGKIVFNNTYDTYKNHNFIE